MSADKSTATARECYRLLSAVLRAAVRDRLISHIPCEGIRLQKRRRKDTDERTITREVFTTQLLPVVPPRPAR